ncbi:MAG: aminoacyl-tRNA deacylase [Nitrospirota bacterium]
MSVTKRLKDYLDENGVQYEIIQHAPTLSAPATAEALHVPGRTVAKVVMIKDGPDDVMTVLPASLKVDVLRIQEVLGHRWNHRIRLATESEFAKVFPDCEVGMMPPFGNLYGLDVLVDSSLTEDEEIVFPAGNARESIRMSYDDFERLVVPRVVDFGSSVLGR